MMTMTENFWKAYRKSPQRYMPAITYVRWVRRFQLGPYRILVGTDCDSEGVISYLHVLYVFKENDDRPYLAVSSEYANGHVPADSPFFCMFFGSKHLNMGSSPENVDFDTFTRKALKAIIEPLDASEESLLEIPLN
jgi:hypothetical protein